MPRTRGGLTTRGGSSSHDVSESSTWKKLTTLARRKGQHVEPALPHQNPPSGHLDEDVIEHDDVDVAREQE